MPQLAHSMQNKSKHFFFLNKYNFIHNCLIQYNVASYQTAGSHKNPAYQIHGGTDYMYLIHTYLCHPNDPL